MKKMFVFLLTVVTVQLMARSPISWTTPPVALSSTGVNASDPHLVVDSNGNTNAIYVENNLIKARTLPSTGSWSAPTQLSTTNHVASSPRITIDGSGNATAVWIENGTVKMASLPLNGSWGTSSSVSNSGASSPALAVDATGNIVIVWIRNGYVETSTKLLGGLLSFVHVLSTNGHESNPDVAIGENGYVVAVWHSQQSTSLTESSDAVYYATTLVDGVWGLSAMIVTDSFHHHYPRVVIDANGNATATWFRYNVVGSSYYNVQAVAASLPASASLSSSITATWNSITALSSSGQGNPANLSNAVKLDSTGNVIVFWTTSYDGTTFATQAAVLPFGGIWSSSSALQLDNLYGFNGGVSVSPSGTAEAIFMNFDGTNLNISTAESDISGTRLNFWANQTNLSVGTDNAYSKIAANASPGTIYAAAAWIQNNGANNIIQATTGSTGVLPPPTNLSVSQTSTSLGAFTDYYNILNWTLSTDPNVVQYLLYRDGIYFSTVNSPATQFIDHNAVANGTVIYGVAAVDSNYAVSPVATIRLF